MYLLHQEKNLVEKYRKGILEKSKYLEERNFCNSWVLQLGKLFLAIENEVFVLDADNLAPI
jgi:hypothetical protein